MWAISSQKPSLYMPCYALRRETAVCPATQNVMSKDNHHARTGVRFSNHIHFTDHLGGRRTLTNKNTALYMLVPCYTICGVDLSFHTILLMKPVGPKCSFTSSFTLDKYHSTTSSRTSKCLTDDGQRCVSCHCVPPIGCTARHQRVRLRRDNPQNIGSIGGDGQLVLLRRRRQHPSVDEPIDSRRGAACCRAPKGRADFGFLKQRQQALG